MDDEERLRRLGEILRGEVVASAAEMARGSGASSTASLDFHVARVKLRVALEALDLFEALDRSEWARRVLAAST